MEKLSLLRNEPEGTYLLMYSARWCGSCKEMKARLANKELPLQAYEVDVDTQQGGRMAANANVRSLPTWVVMRGNVELGRKMGSMNSEAFIEWLTTFK